MIDAKKDLQNSNEEIYKSRWFILAVLVMQPFMACLDSSIVNVALPIIQKNLGSTMAGTEWIVSSYLIVISATILIFGRLGDMHSKSSIFIKGIIIFVVGSLLCGISPTLEILVISRVIQAIGASMLMATNQGIITDVFPPQERGKALGISGSFVALGSILGPALGGFIVTYFTWHYIFLINIPIGIISYIFAKKYLPIRISNNSEGMDKPGAIMFFIATILIFTSILLGQHLGFASLYVVLGLIIGFLIIALFLMFEDKTKNPMLHLHLFKKPIFSVSLICAFISFTAINTINVIQPFYLNDILNYSPGKISIIMTAYPIVLFVVAPLSGSLSDKIGSKLLTLIGLFLTGVSLVLLATLNSNSKEIVIFLMLSLLGFANGLFQSPNTNLIMSSVPKDKLGIAGGTNALIRNLGLAFGVSASTSILYYKMSTIAGYRVLGAIPGKPEIFISGMKFVYILIASLCFIGFVISLIEHIMSKDK
ncbi:MFS transporter [Clostridium sp. B9]|uniref:MFS transporter n=1 Tax=Clostridium sp. B9 TaxID=3423224 RepID=UPI003D2F198A